MSSMLPRTYLFVPGNRPERFDKALASGADAVVLDLEDAVAPAAKADARQAIAQWAAQAQAEQRQRCVLRINEAGAAAQHTADLALLRSTGLPVAMLAKAESPEQIHALTNAVPGVQVLALIESARGLAAAQAIAATPGVRRLVFGTLDFALDLGLDISTHADGLVMAASALVLASRLAGLPAPVGGVTPQLDDEARLLGDLAWGQRLGLGAKLCVHPRQVAPIHRALAPDDAAIAWAQRVLAADAASPGAAQLDGRMIDRPVVLQAQRTLARAGL